MKRPDPTSGEARMHAVHHVRLGQIHEQAEAIRGTADMIANAIAESLAAGGQISIQPQIAFLTSAFARMQKDWGVVEQLQQQGVRHRPASNNVRHG